jgi:iron(III) transport system substrate-binding protein
MRYRMVLVLAMAVGLSGIGLTLAQTPAQQEWLKAAGLGSFSPASQDWKAIEDAARKEGKVVIYSVSSRTVNLQKEFKEKYGVEIVSYDMSSDDQLVKFTREHKAGVFQADVLFNNDAPTLHGDLLPQKMIWNFVPDPVAPYIDEDEKKPFLVQRWSSRVFIYNTALNPAGPPVDNIWDFTRKEWKGKVMTPEPISAVMANVYQTILRYPEKMAAAYQKEFGQPVKLSSGMQNAAEEWLLQFMKNDPVILESTDKIFEGVGNVKQQNPPLGVTTFSKLRDVKKGVYEASPIYEMEPVFGVAYPTVLLICDRAPHPNAAKLLIRYMMTDGFYPWNVLGDYATHKDVQAGQVKKFNIPPISKVKMLKIDPKHIYDTKFQFMQFYMSLPK